jgi:hypothetical protein
MLSATPAVSEQKEKSKGNREERGEKVRREKYNRGYVWDR